MLGRISKGNRLSLNCVRIRKLHQLVVRSSWQASYKPINRCGSKSSRHVYSRLTNARASSAVLQRFELCERHFADHVLKAILPLPGFLGFGGVAFPHRVGPTASSNARTGPSCSESSARKRLSVPVISSPRRSALASARSSAALAETLTGTPEIFSCGSISGRRCKSDQTASAVSGKLLQRSQ
jgi:hypothetical protein